MGFKKLIKKLRRFFTRKEKAPSKTDAEEVDRAAAASMEGGSFKVRPLRPPTTDPSMMTADRLWSLGGQYASYHTCASRVREMSSRGYMDLVGGNPLDAVQWRHHPEWQRHHLQQQQLRWEQQQQRQRQQRQEQEQEQHQQQIRLAEENGKEDEDEGRRSCQEGCGAQGR